MKGKVLKAGFACAAVCTVALAAVGVSSGSTARGSASDTLVFGASADPTLLDPALVSDGESLRVADQIFEGLTALKPGTLTVIPGLATSWVASKDAKTFTFTLRKGVNFHDGTPFNAAAVCANFDRWYHFPTALQSDAASYYYGTVFAGFAKPGKGSPGPKSALYKSCVATGDDMVVISLKRGFGPFTGVLSLPSFAMQSPTAMKLYGADKGTLDAQGVFRAGGTYGTAHPVGTGPYVFISWTLGDKLVIQRNDLYWGKRAAVKTVIFKPIADNAARLQALQTGEIQGFDNVEPQDMATISKDSSLLLLDRPAFNVGYVTINQKVKPFDNPLVRQAVAYGLDREAVVKAFYAGRGEVAMEFQPPSLLGWTKGVAQYPYNPEKAKALLKQAGLTLPVAVDFWYPTDVSRPYMPDPKRNFEAFAASLNKSGFKVTAHSAPWRPDYVGRVQAGTAGALNLIGWTGDYGDPDNFLGSFFRTEQTQWGFNNPTLFKLLDDAVAEPDQAKRAVMYGKANKLIMSLVLGVPYVHTKPAVAFRANVTGYIPSPVSLEPFSTVVIK